MATLGREWVSVEQAQQWIDTYDPKYMSQQVVDTMGKELKSHKKPRWFGAILVDAHTVICHEGGMRLQAIVRTQHGEMCWIARANNFHFSEASLERTADGYRFVQRTMDMVRITPVDERALLDANVMCRGEEDVTDER